MTAEESATCSGKVALHRHLPHDHYTRHDLTDFHMIITHFMLSGVFDLEVHFHPCAYPRSPCKKTFLISSSDSPQDNHEHFKTMIPHKTPFHTADGMLLKNVLKQINVTDIKKSADGTLAGKTRPM